MNNRSSLSVSFVTPFFAFFVVLRLNVQVPRGAVQEQSAYKEAGLVSAVCAAQSKCAHEIGGRHPQAAASEQNHSGNGIV